MSFLRKLYFFLEDESGLSVVEYVVGAALLVGVLTAFFSFQSDLLTQTLVGVFN